DNADPTKAKVGDTVTITIALSESVQTLAVTILGHAVTAEDLGGGNWSASYTLQSTDAEGEIPFTIDFVDLAGNAGMQATDVTIGEKVVFDKTAPVLTQVTMTSDNANPTRAKVGDTVTITIALSESVQTLAVTILDHAVTADDLGGGNWSASYTLQSTDVEG